MNFTTKLSGQNATTFNITKEPLDSTSEFLVEWEFVAEMREWGVKGIYVYITKVVGLVSVDYLDNHKTKEINIDSNDDKWDIDTEFASNYELGDCIQPQSICVDIESSIITVYFY